MGIIVKLIGSGIGLASEAIAHRKSQSSRTIPTPAESSTTAAARALTQDAEAPPEYVEVSEEHGEQLIAQGHAVKLDAKEQQDVKERIEDEEDLSNSTSEEGDEEHWELDDAIEAQSPAAEETPARSERQIIDTFMQNHPPPAYRMNASPQPKLPCPVIIPQRRPRNKSRGFVRAYAPVLEDCGIDQATFLDFLKTFHQSSKESPWLQVINMAAMAAGMVPNPIVMGVTIAIQVAVGVAIEVQRRTRSNSFLDRMNDEFFRPRGLYCLIVTYKPESTQTHETININKAISKYVAPQENKLKQFGRDMRISSGKTYGEMEMPEAAPLIFPALDRVAADTSKEGTKVQDKLKSGQKFVADYFDRRAQAEFSGHNPTATLAHAPEKQFTSRYADPNHPASSGSLISLLTGGMLDPIGRRQQRRGARRVRKAMRRGEDITPQTTMSRRQRLGRQGIVKRMLKKDVLYLMIVNMPSEEDLQAGINVVGKET